VSNPADTALTMARGARASDSARLANEPKVEVAEPAPGEAPPHRRWTHWLADLVLGTHPKLRVRVLFGLLPMLIYLGWCAMHVYCAHVGFMRLDAARFMLLYDVIGL